MLPLGIYVIVDAAAGVDHDQLVEFIRAGFVIFFFLLVFLVFHSVFPNNYYGLSFYMLLLGVVFKIVVDWIQTEFSVAMTTILATSLLTFNFNMDIVYTVILNSLNSANFIIRIVVVYYA